MTNTFNTKAIFHYLHVTFILIVLAMAAALTINLIDHISSLVVTNFVDAQATKYVMGNLIDVIMEYGVECVAGVYALKAMFIVA